MSDVTPIRPDMSTKIQQSPVRTTDARELMIAENYPAAALAVKRIFQRICPTLDLLDFNAFGAGERHWISFSGPETELLRLGLVTAAMLPARPKFLFRDKIGDEFYRIRRRAGSRLEVYLPLTESLPRSHLLAPLAAYSWPFVDTGPTSRPSFLRLVVDNTRAAAGVDHGRD